MAQFILPQETINKVLHYLANQPYIQVVGLIEELKQARPLVSGSGRSQAPPQQPEPESGKEE